jgi:hypothetical protein
MGGLLVCDTIVINTLLCAVREKGVAMKPYKSEGSNEHEGREFIRAPRDGEEEAMLGSSFEGLDGAKTFSRRQALGLLGGSLAGISLLSLGLATPAKSQPNYALPFRNFDHISLEWYSNTVPFSFSRSTAPINKFLDGRTQNGTVGLAPHTNPPFTGTRWEVVRRNPGTWPPTWWLRCLGNVPGPQWLDGRTHNGTVGLAPTRSAPYTGTRWEIARWTAAGSPPDLIYLKSLGDVPGPRELTGYPYRGAAGTVGLSENNGSLWRVRILPK